MGLYDKLKDKCDCIDRILTTKDKTLHQLYIRRFLKVGGFFPESIADINGYAVVCDEPCLMAGLYDEIFFYGLYDIEISNCKTVIDAGANIGVSVIRFKYLYPDARFICFEPSKRSFFYLKQNIENNHIVADLHNVALADYDGEINFNVNLNSGENSVFTPATDKVKCARLSNYITAYVDLLKLDIEKSEYAVIDDLIRANKLKWILNLVIEFHDLEHSDVCRYLNLLSMFGFDVRIKWVTRGVDGGLFMIVHCKRNN